MWAEKGAHVSQNAVKGVKDFCISYTQADRPWAEWIAWHLEEAGYSTVLQPWHVRPASNVVMEMDRATQVATCTLVVLSSEYLHADDTKAEWAAAFNRDPKGQQGILVPVRVRSCDVMRLCRPIASSIDLVNLDEPQAREALLTGVQRARARPARSPSFPGSVSPRFPGARLPLWLLPFRRNPFFTGREEVLRCLHDPFTTGTPTAVTQMISGLGGIGKTQTAVEYAHRYQSEYRAVLWVRADSQQSIISSFVEIAHVLKLPEHDAKEQEQIVQAVKWWLRTYPNWLLIVDNADDLEAIDNFLPSGSGHLLITTRAHATGRTAHAVALETMDLDEGTLLLLRRAKLVSPTESLAMVPERERTDAENITQELGGLPLALDQAGAYIEETGCRLSDYLERYHRHPTFMLKRRGAFVVDYPDSVATTWVPSFEKVQQANAAAAELLRLCAFLAPDVIPEDLIVAGGALLGPVLEATVADPLAFDEAIGVLLSHSLLHRNREERTLSMHQLIQVVLKDGMDEAMQRQWAERTVGVVSHAFPAVAVETESLCQRLLPHALVSVGLSEQWEFTSPEVTHLLNKTVSYLHDRAQYEEAEPLYERALHIFEQVLGPEHSDVAQSLNNLAILYCEQGRYEEAEPLYERALHIFEQVLGPEHSDVAQSLNNLAILYCEQGRYKEAEPLYERALSILLRSFGLDHPLLMAVAENYTGLLEQVFHKDDRTTLRDHLFGRLFYRDRSRATEREQLELQALS